MEAASAALSLAVCALAVYIGASSAAFDGLECTDYPNSEWAGPPSATRVEPDVASPGLVLKPTAESDQVSTECRGWLFVERAGLHTFILGSDDASALYIDEVPVVENYGHHSMLYLSRAHPLVPGARALRIRYAQAGGGRGFLLLHGADGAQPAPLSAAHVSRRPLTRMAFVLRPWTGLLQMALLATAGVLIVWAFGRSLTAVAARTGRAFGRCHRFATATPPKARASCWWPQWPRESWSWPARARFSGRTPEWSCHGDRLPARRVVESRAVSHADVHRHFSRDSWRGAKRPAPATP